MYPLFWPLYSLFIGRALQGSSSASWDVTNRTASLRLPSLSQGFLQQLSFPANLCTCNFHSLFCSACTILFWDAIAATFPILQGLAQTLKAYVSVTPDECNPSLIDPPEKVSPLMLNLYFKGIQCHKAVLISDSEEECEKRSVCQSALIAFDKGFSRLVWKHRAVYKLGEGIPLVKGFDGFSLPPQKTSLTLRSCYLTAEHPLRVHFWMYFQWITSAQSQSQSYHSGVRRSTQQDIDAIWIRVGFPLKVSQASPTWYWSGQQYPDASGDWGPY